MCFNITVSALIIGCCANGTRFVGRNAVHWSRLIHPKCNMTAVDNIVIDSGSGGGTEWWIIILLVFFIIIISIWVVGSVGKSKEEEEGSEKIRGGCRGRFSVTYYLFLFYLTILIAVILCNININITV